MSTSRRLGSGSAIGSPSFTCRGLSVAASGLWMSAVARRASDLLLTHLFMDRRLGGSGIRRLSPRKSRLSDLPAFVPYARWIPVWLFRVVSTLSMWRLSGDSRSLGFGPALRRVADRRHKPRGARDVQPAAVSADTVKVRRGA